MSENHNSNGPIGSQQEDNPYESPFTDEGQLNDISDVKLSFLQQLGMAVIVVPCSVICFGVTCGTIAGMATGAFPSIGFVGIVAGFVGGAVAAIYVARRLNAFLKSRLE